MPRTNRVPQNQRIRSITLTGSAAVLVTTVELTETSLAHVVQDDIKIVGAMVQAHAALVDAHLNADGSINMLADISRAGLPFYDSCLVYTRIHTLWTAAIVVGNEICKQQYIFYPTGLGVEVDEGELINLNVNALWVGAGGDVTVAPSGIIYYIEL